MGQVKSSIPDTIANVEIIMNDLTTKIAQKEKDLEDEKGNEVRNMKSIMTLKMALENLKRVSKDLEDYKQI